MAMISDLIRRVGLPRLGRNIIICPLVRTDNKHRPLYLRSECYNRLDATAQTLRTTHGHRAARGFHTGI